MNFLMVAVGFENHTRKYGCLGCDCKHSYNALYGCALRDFVDSFRAFFLACDFDKYVVGRKKDELDY